MWPVILRELRAGARRWTTYWLRLLAAGAVVVAIGWWLTTPQSITVRQPGREVFLQMHRVILAAIWIIVPLMTADTLSREKREGTLGLLFLTNLRAWNIVFAKTAAAGLAALTLWLSVIPIITVPVLLGGLPPAEIILSCSLALGSICVALAAGLLASASTRRASGAVALALSWAWVGHIAFCLMASEVQNSFVGVTSPGWLSGSVSGPIAYRALMTWNLFADTYYARGVFVGSVMVRGPAPALSPAVFVIPLLSLLAALVAGWFASLLIRRNWQDRPKTKRQNEVEQFFCAPVFWKDFYRRWMRRALERNPIGWLEKRSWTGRITALVWLAIMISFASAAAARLLDTDGYNVLMWIVIVSVAYVAAGSFRRERETGALELILVTPLSERQIILGRLRGLWSQFLPTFLLWLAVVIYLSSGLGVWHVAGMTQLAVAYLIVPVVGLYFSLRSRFVLLAWFATLTVCFALPQLVWWLALRTLDPMELALRQQSTVWNSSPWVGVDLLDVKLMVIVPLQLALAAFLFRRLRVNLARRSFSLR